MSDPTPLDIKGLAETHLHRYASMLRQAESGVPNLRIGELRVLLRIWRSVVAKEYRLEALDPDERGEVMDAWWDR